MYCWWESKLVQLLWKIAWWFLKKVNTELPSTSNATSGGLPQRNESRDSNRYLYMNAHSSNIHKSQKVETTQWTHKQNTVIACRCFYFFSFPTRAFPESTGKLSFVLICEIYVISINITTLFPNPKTNLHQVSNGFRQWGMSGYLTYNITLMMYPEPRGLPWWLRW